MVRRTSLETYRAIQADNLLNEQRWMVYRLLYEHGPATSTELSQLLAEGAREAPHRRLPELRDCGAAYEVVERPCKVTGRKCIVWDVTADLPDESKLKKPKRPKAEVLAAAHTELRTVYAYYRQCGGVECPALEQVGQWLKSIREAE
jgi:hypothetical protein